MVHQNAVFADFGVLFIGFLIKNIRFRLICVIWILINPMRVFVSDLVALVAGKTKGTARGLRPAVKDRNQPEKAPAMGDAKASEGNKTFVNLSNMVKP